MIVDLFAGAGGWDVAAQRLGMDPIGVEIMPDCVKIREAAGLQTLDMDVRALDPSEFHPIEGLIGSPPCQTFSVAGAGAGRAALYEVLLALGRVSRGESIDLDHLDERTGLVVQPLRWALELEPEWIALEQVPTVLPVWEAIGSVLEADGYHVRTGLLHAEQYGSPQTRKRAVLIAARWPIEMPTPTHSRFHPRNPTSVDDGMQKWVSMVDVLPGRSAAAGMRSNYGTGGDPKKRGYRFLHEPSMTVTSKINRNRWDYGTYTEPVLTHEAGMLQGFDRDFPWEGDGSTRYEIIGNAVPVQLAQAILAAVTAGRT